MKKFFAIFMCVLCTTLSANATYWICTVKKNLNMREIPTTIDNEPICQIPAGDYIVIDDEDCENGFVYAVWVAEDIYGYVSEKYIKKEQVLETREEDVLQETGYISQYDPELVIENQCDRSITVSLNGSQYWFDIGETKTIIMPSGKVSIFASSPGVIPFSTTQYVSSNHSYEWQFYIKHEYRRK